MKFASWEKLVEYVCTEQDAGVVEVVATRKGSGIEFVCTEEDGSRIVVVLTAPEEKPLRALEMLLLSDAVAAFIRRVRNECSAESSRTG